MAIARAERSLCAAMFIGDATADIDTSISHANTLMTRRKRERARR